MKAFRVTLPAFATPSALGQSAAARVLMASLLLAGLWLCIGWAVAIP